MFPGVECFCLNHLIISFITLKEIDCGLVMVTVILKQCSSREKRWILKNIDENIHSLNLLTLCIVHKHCPYIVYSQYTRSYY